MIDINEAIEKSKNMPNISAGGSSCFDFDDVVLVKYTLPLKYVKENYRARENQEDVMRGINEKVKLGVNTPQHYAMKRVVENEDDICYVLQQKCPGFNCASVGKYGAPYEKCIQELERVDNIPFSHYVKLIKDSCNLLEMGYESKNKNLFYDPKSGFWFIDFLYNNSTKKFCSDNPVRIFESIKYNTPKPRQIASYVGYNTELTDEQRQNYESLENSINAKFFFAIKEAIPNFERYEKFYFSSNNKNLKNYLMKNKLVKTNLNILEESDYQVYDELYNIVIENIVHKIICDNDSFWNVECNDIRNDSSLFNLLEWWKVHKDNLIKKEDYDDDYDYENALCYSFTDRMLNEIAARLEYVDKTPSVKSFLEDMYAKNNHSKTK